jgi:uncharacterized iron-regulated membrane protein
MKPATWRKWHRWVGFPAALFLLFAGITGIIVAATEFWGADEALREATRDLVSPVRTSSADSLWAAPIGRAFRAAQTAAGDAPVDRVVMTFKGDQPTVTVFLGKPTGGEDRRVVVGAKDGQVIEVASYADKPLIHRIHSGEAFGDGGLVFAMFWGLAMVILTLTGLIIYWRMRRPNAVGWKRVFW